MPNRSITRSSLANQALDVLRARIFSHALEPGQRLDETALAEELGISRTPLREALKTLSAEGLVELQPHRGCFVTELSLQDLREIFPLMAMLEGQVAHAVARNADAAQLKVLDGLHEKLERHAATGHVDRYYVTNYEFHESLQNFAGNRWLGMVIGDLRKMLKLSRHRSLRFEGRLQDSLAEHRALIAALHSRDADAAERIMRGHLLAQLSALEQMSAAANNAGGNGHD